MKRTLSFLFILQFCILSICAQNVIHGIVISSDDDQPLINARIVIPGGQVAALTNAEGKFTITLPSKVKQINVSYTGYETKTIEAKDGMRILLTPSSVAMNEVMVVAFGKQKREAFTGAATVVNSEKITAQQVNNPLEAINGQVSGVQMTTNNDPVGDPTIRVRGISSLNAGNSPLIVLDGLPYNGYYSDINPNDIESITVLKDASSNALYGARGANGVILITTKQAQKGSTKVTLTSRIGCNQDARVDYDCITDPGQYMEAHYTSLYNYFVRAKGQSAYDAHRNANATFGKSASEGGIEYVPFTVPADQYLIGENGRLNPNATLGSMVKHAGQDYWVQPDDWRSAGLRNGLRQEYNLNVTGGRPQQSFMASWVTSRTKV